MMDRSTLEAHLGDKLSALPPLGDDMPLATSLSR